MNAQVCEKGGVPGNEALADIFDAVHRATVYCGEVAAILLLRVWGLGFQRVVGGPHGIVSGCGGSMKPGLQGF